jgi:hypothetical protein
MSIKNNMFPLTYRSLISAAISLSSVINEPRKVNVPTHSQLTSFIIFCLFLHLSLFLDVVIHIPWYVIYDWRYISIGADITQPVDGNGIFMHF